MTIVKTVKPAGGGDFTTLADWVAWAKAQPSVDVAAECYSGNLGTCSWGASSTWTATDWSPTAYPRIYAAPGNRHDGHTIGSGAYVYFGTGATGIDTNNCPFEIDGLHFFADTGAARAVAHSSFTGTPAVGPRNLLNTFTYSLSTNAVAIDIQMGRVVSSSAKAINNICAGTSVLQAAFTFRQRSGAAVPQLSPLEFYNNTVRQLNIGLNNAIAGDTVILKNNILLNSMTIYGVSNPGDMVSQNNLYAAGFSFLTLDAGGTGIVSGVNPNTLFRGLSTGDLRLLANSPARNAGTTIESITTDAVGNARPEGASYDIGALEYQPTDEPTPPPITFQGNPGDSTLVFRGPTSADADFTMHTVPNETLISGGSSSTVTTDDSEYLETTTATIDHDCYVHMNETVQGSLDSFRFDSINPAIATVDEVTGKVTRHADGTTGIICRGRLVSKRVNVTVSREGGATTQQFTGFVAGSLLKHCADAIDSRISGVTPATVKPVYSSQNHSSGEYVRNPACWLADLDLTCFSPWNSTGANKMAGVAISPRHVYFANHYHPNADATIRFVDMSGNTITRTISSLQAVAGAGFYKDIIIGKLDADLPEEISFAKVFPANWMDFVPGHPNGWPLVGLDQEEKAFVVETDDINDPESLYPTIDMHCPVTADRQAMWEYPVHLDSGNPVFAIVDDELVIVTVWTFGGYGSGTPISNHITDVNSVLTSLGGGYQLTEVDLSGFTDYS